MKTFSVQNSGFVALMSVIIISFVLLTMAVTLNFTGFFGRFNVLDSELKERSNALAEACMDAALLKLAQESTFIGTESVTIDTETCDFEIFSGGEVHASAESNDAFTHFRAEVDTGDSDLPFVEFEECAVYQPAPNCN